MELQLATAEKQVLEELVKLLQRRNLRGENGNWKQFLALHDQEPPNDPSKRSRDDLVAFLITFKKKEVLEYLLCHANHLLIDKLKEESPDNDSPEESLVRLTVEHSAYSGDYMFEPYSTGWFVSDIGLKGLEEMESTEIIAVDCEMVLCEDGTEGLVRVGVVDRDLKVILDEFVKPGKPVVDYRTDITGITPQDIDKATLSVADVQETLQPFLSKGVILVGHSLNKDLEVLKIDHPKVIDTSLVFKYPNARRLRRPSLNNLCESMLGYGVRKTGVPHDCVQDAAATMKLALAVIEKRVGTTIFPSKEMLEAERAKLFLHKIPRNVPPEELDRVLSGKFTLDVKPARTQGGYYCAFVGFNSPEEANEACENVDGNQSTDSLGLPQKVIAFKLRSGSRASLYVRKMVRDE